MSDHDTFLRAIRAAPDDDTPRLVFADWLDEHGDPARAEFIRVQVELEPVRDRIDDPRVQALADREKELLARHRDAWLGPAADLARDRPQFGPEFVRGFPAVVGVSLDTLLRRGGELFAACPTVRGVAVFGVAGRGHELEECPDLAGVQALEVADFGPAADPDDSAALARVVRHARIPAVTVWAPCGPSFFHHMTGVVTEPWFRTIELVELTGEADREDRWDEHTRAWEGPANTGRVLRTRPTTGLFPLLGDVGHGFYAGHLPSGAATLAVVMPGGRRISLTTFDEAGRVSKTVWEDRRDGEWTLPGLGERFGFRPGLIRVREFATHTGVALRLWPAGYVRDYLLDRPPVWDPAADWSRGGMVRLWLQRGWFVLTRGRDEFWADRTGRIFGA